MKSREGCSREAFIKYFKQRLINQKIAGEVWDCFVEISSLPNKKFKPMPTDDIITVFGMMDEDLDDLAFKILKKFNCYIPTNEEMDDLHIATLEDLIQFIAKQYVHSTRNQ